MNDQVSDSDIRQRIVWALEKAGLLVDVDPTDNARFVVSETILEPQWEVRVVIFS